ncbi:chorismate-binding protein [Pseudomonas sp. IT-P294]|uniref:chorismate-binding protein n=1 Tax=Pseudomonas sp. IT-P294 TaxID=3026454 RepID=UPI0039DFACA8
MLKSSTLLFKSSSNCLRLDGKSTSERLLFQDGDHGKYWDSIEESLAAGVGFFGFISFDCFNEWRRSEPNMALAAFVEIEDVSSLQLSLSKSEPPCAFREGSWVRSSEGEQRFLKTASTVIQGFEKLENPLERLTLARRVDATSLVDVLASFETAHPHRCSRAFALNIAGYEMVGESPELLLAGNIYHFRTYKLAGTAPRSNCIELDQQLRSQMRDSNKLIYEHELSAEATMRVLSQLGRVSKRGTYILPQRHLRHLVSILETVVCKDIPLRSILSAVAPSGASPRHLGLQALNKLEEHSRGPYYGLAGYVMPNGVSEFVQIIRTVIRTPTYPSWHTWVGASIVRGSTSKSELDETKLKLQQVRYIAGSPYT